MDLKGLSVYERAFMTHSVTARAAEPTSKVAGSAAGVHEDLGVRPALSVDAAEVERRRVVKAAAEFAASDFGVPAQRTLVHALHRYRGPSTVGEKQRFAEVLDTVRRALPNDRKADLEVVARFFRDSGVARLRARDNEAKPGDLQLDRGRLVELLASAKGNGGELEAKHASEISLMVERTFDRYDLLQAQLHLQRAVARRELNPGLARSLLVVIAKKLGSTVGFEDVTRAWKVVAGDTKAPSSQRFKDADVKAFKALLDHGPVSDQVLFAAKRIALFGALDRLIAAATVPSERGRLESVRRDLATFFADKTRGKVDQQGLDRDYQKRLRSGELTQQQYRALKVAVYTSSTLGVLALTVRQTLFAVTTVFRQFLEYLEAANDTWRSLTRSTDRDMSERVSLERVEQQRTQQTSGLRATAKKLRGEEVRAPTLSERDAKRAEGAAAESGLADVDRPMQ
jgi:hypothetical protein